MTALQDRFAAIADEHGPNTTLPTEDLLGLALELQLAAILLRDLTEAMPASLLVSMPPALANRLYAGHYQDTLDSCVPDSLKPAVKELIALDPDIIRARADSAR